MQCPGQDNRYWDGEAVFETPCPNCGNELEFFKDDSQRSCKQCGKRVLNPRIDFGCAAYCSHAEQCLGSMPPELLAKQKNLFKDRLAIAVRRRLLGQEELFLRATKRTAFAEQLCKQEQRGDMASILAATLLLDCPEPLEILDELQAGQGLAEDVATLLGQQELRPSSDVASADIFHDACLLTGIWSQTTTAPPVFKTASGAACSTHT